MEVIETDTKKRKTENNTSYYLEFVEMVHSAAKSRKEPRQALKIYGKVFNWVKRFGKRATIQP